jgi:hypothetical protein
LKHESEVLAAEGAQVDERARAVEHGRAVDGDAAGGRRVDQRHGGEHGGFAAPLGPSMPTISPRAMLQRGIADGDDLGVAAAIDLAQVADLDGGRTCGGSCGEHGVGFDAHGLPDAEQAGDGGDARRR